MPEHEEIEAALLAAKSFRVTDPRFELFTSRIREALKAGDVGLVHRLKGLASQFARLDGFLSMQPALKVIWRTAMVGEVTLETSLDDPSLAYFSLKQGGTVVAKFEFDLEAVSLFIRSREAARLSVSQEWLDAQTSLASFAVMS